MQSVFFRTVSILLLLLLLSPVQVVFAGASFDTIETDTPNRKMFGFFDLRDRETFIQILLVQTLTPEVIIFTSSFLMSAMTVMRMTFLTYTHQTIHTLITLGT